MRKCSNCGVDVPENEVYEIDGNELCDDCSLIVSRQKTILNCDNNPDIVPIKRAEQKK